MLARMSVFIRADKINQELYRCEDNILALVKTGRLVFSGGDGAKGEVSAGEAICFHSGIEYKRTLTECGEIYLFRFRADEKIFENGKIAFIDKTRIESTINMLDKLYELSSADKYIFAQALFLDIVNLYLIEKAFSSNNSHNDNTEISKAVRMIERNIKSNVQLTEIASSLGISYSSFFRRFKEHMGMTPIKYVISTRIKKAKIMLSETELPINKISEELGFESEYYFSNSFKKEVGVSPLAFRKSIIK